MLRGCRAKVIELPRLFAIAAVGSIALPACSKDEVIRAEGTDSGLGSDATPAVACPSGLPGAALVRIDSPGGETYCMDQREVTWGEYDGFVAKKGADMSGQPPECDWNTTYTPQYVDPGNDTPPPYTCPAPASAPAKDAPANCVDFCDALAYCESSGKRLCGRVGGPKKWGRVDIAVTEDAGPVAPQWDALQKTATSTDMEFQYVCTQGGTTKYPYGDQYEPGKCIDADWVAAKGSNSLGVTDLSNRSCTGTSPP